MIIDILSGFPESFTGLLNSSIIAQAMQSDAVDIWAHNLRHYSGNRHGKIDDEPYGGGAGMVLMARPIWNALDMLRRQRTGHPSLICMSAKGEPLTQRCVRALSEEEWIVILCGHYKDVDARIFERDDWREISIGDYVLSGGEIPASVLTDAVVRLLPGVLGNADSAADDSYEDGLLDAPYYTKPEEIDGYRVPDVLLSGHHKNIAEWRLRKRLELTGKRRPDLWQAYLAGKEEKQSNR